MISPLGSFVKDARVNTGKTLLEFCLEHNLNITLWSTVECGTATRSILRHFNMWQVADFFGFDDAAKHEFFDLIRNHTPVCDLGDSKLESLEGLMAANVEIK